MKSLLFRIIPLGSLIYYDEQNKPKVYIFLNFFLNFGFFLLFRGKQAA